MSVELINPNGIVNLPVHHQVSMAQGSKIISLAGQVSWDADAQLVGQAISPLRASRHISTSQ